jgi:hypothetical protein
MSPTWRMMVHLSPVLALQALRRKLDGRERVLDLVGDAAGHVAPGGAALRRDQARDVVEGEHQPPFRAARHPHAQATGLRVPGHVHLVVAHRPLGLIHHARQLRRHLGQRPAQSPRLVQRQ